MLLNQTNLAKLTHHPGGKERILAEPRPGSMSEYQKQLREYERCFRGQLFDDKNRIYTWGTLWEKGTGRPICRDHWKPLFVPSIARDLVETHCAYLAGDDKFPSINITSPDGAFTGLEPAEGYETPEEGMAKAQADALQAWSAELFRLAKLQQTVYEAAQEAFVKGEAPVLIRTYGNKIYLTVPDRTWCNWTYSEQDPDEVESFSEAYFFKRENEEGKEEEYLFQREITTVEWTQWERRVIKDGQGKETLEDSAPTFYNRHGLGFCPVAIFSTPDGRSLYADEVLENIKGHIEWYNDIKAGIRNNMEPQWVLLRDESDKRYQAGRPGGDDSPLEKDTLWELEGKSIQSFANQTAGYEMADKSLKDECSDLRRYAHIIDIPPDNQQSGVALMLRMAPQYTAVQRFRNAVGEALRCLCEKILKVAQTQKDSLKLPLDLPRPQKLTTFTIALDWGAIIPVTPESINLELGNIERMKQAGLMSTDTAQAYTLPLFGVEDIEAERLKITQEQEANRELEIQMANAAFEKMTAEEE